MRTAINVYSVRDLDESTESIVRRVAQAGYDGIQFSGHRSPLSGNGDSISELLAETDLEVTPPHVGMDTLIGDRPAVLSAFAPFDVDAVVIPAIDPEHFTSGDSVDAIAARVTRLADDLTADDWCLHYHNHAFEYRDIGGEIAFDRFVRRTDVGIELDVGWAHVGGDDPAARIRSLGDRVRLVHMKDVDETGDPCEIGDGVVDMPACARAAADAGTEWLIYEHDQPTNPVRSIAHGADVLASIVSDM